MKTMKLNIILLLALMVPLFADAFNTKVESVAGCPGSEIAVPITVTGMNGVSAISLALSYDVDKLDYLGYQDVNANLSDNLLINENNGRIMISWYSITPININEGILLWLRFDTGDNGDANLNWVTSLCEYAGETGNVLTSTYTNGIVSVYDNPFITSNPENVVIFEGQNANFTASANGYELGYQWQISIDDGLIWTDLQNGGCYSNVTTGTLKVSGVTVEMSGYLYRCSVSSSCGNAVYTDSASLTVNVKPTFIEAVEVEWGCNEGAYQDIMVDKFNNVGAFSLVLNIDTNYVEFVECINLNPVLTAENFMANQSGNKIYFSYASVDGFSIAAGRLFSIMFDSQIGTSYNTWQLDLCEIADVEGNVLNAGYANGSFSVVSECTTQSKEMVSGWNWYSTYIEISDIDGLAMLEDALGESAAQIASQTAFTKFYGLENGWYGSLTSINNESMYRIKIKEGETPTVTMTGALADPADHPIILQSGWTHIGYISNSQMSVNEALVSLTPNQGDLIKTQTAYAKYYGPENGWYGSLNIIRPGDGLMFKSSKTETDTLIYPVALTGVPTENLKIDDNHWMSDMFAYQSNMTVLAVVELDGEEVTSDNYELAAFVDGECRGSVRLVYAEPVGRYVAYLTIAGDEPAALTLGLYNTLTGEEIFNNNTLLKFAPDDVIGITDDMFVASFNTLGVDEVDDNVMIYPNLLHAGGIINIVIPGNSQDITVEMLNSLGEVVMIKTVSSGHAVTAPDVPGVYIMRLTASGKKVIYRKIYCY